jgi:hypothetical protein
LGGQFHSVLWAEESNDGSYMNITKELHQLAENNREIEARQIDIKIEVVRFLGLFLQPRSAIYTT